MTCRGSSLRLSATLGLELAPWKKRQYALGKKAEERAWAKRSGPVEVWIDPELERTGAGSSTEGRGKRSARAAASRTATTRSKPLERGDP